MEAVERRGEEVEQSGLAGLIGSERNHEAWQGLGPRVEVL